jgi:superfamily II DNA/RNA helicase
LLKALNEINFKYPTEIQELSIPAIITGKDVLGSSMTGSGKTAAFLLPIMQNLFK